MCPDHLHQMLSLTAAPPAGKMYARRRPLGYLELISKVMLWCSLWLYTVTRWYGLPLVQWCELLTPNVSPSQVHGREIRVL